MELVCGIYTGTIDFIPFFWRFRHISFGKPHIRMYQLNRTVSYIQTAPGISRFFFSQERITQTKAEMREERIKRLGSEKSALEAHLKMLQAQIEPHFLFNSLSTVLTLMDNDPEKAGKMLTDLIQFLRVSLSKTRAGTTTIGQEMEMARAYLNIYQIRMGDRLQYHIQAEEDLKKISIPPMLVQPLVENAIKHGLEPAVAGGLITINAHKDNHQIMIT
jgi:sensor histidine kinase YesM